MDDDIIWENPPEQALMNAPRGRYKEFAAALRRRRETWAVLPGAAKKTRESAKSTALNIRSGRVQGFAKGQYETAVDGVKIYVRYVGPELTPQQEAQAQADADQPVARSAAAPRTPSVSPEEAGLSQVEADRGRGALIRQWARDQGFAVPDRGRLSQNLVDAFEKAHNRVLPPHQTEAEADREERRLRSM